MTARSFLGPNNPAAERRRRDRWIPRRLARKRGYGSFRRFSLNRWYSVTHDTRSGRVRITSTEAGPR